jgi:SpoIID/LytB domain protein
MAVRKRRVSRRRHQAHTRANRPRSHLVVLRAALALLACLALARWASLPEPVAAQQDVGEGELGTASHRTISVRVGGGGGRVSVLPLEVYVARVISAEGEPNAPAATQQALAVAVRTFTVVNARRHAREGFALCDTTHCQVLRASTPASRQAAFATAGRILTYNGSPAEVFYSASCGGRSERASEIWPNANFPYLDSVVDDVHGEDAPWTLEMPLREIQEAVARSGSGAGRLTGVEVDARSVSGRAARLRLSGMRPETMTGESFRAAIGTRTLRSTAFSIETSAEIVRFTGRGYGHGVGMCVIGAGRRAKRGDNVEQILAAYYPGLALASLDGTASGQAPQQPPAGGGVERLDDLVPVLPREETPPRPESRPTPPAPPVSRPVAPAPPPATGLMDAQTLQARVQRARDHVAAALGVAPPAVVVELTQSIEQFRRATGRPWWVAAAPARGRIIVAPTALTDPERLDDLLRMAIAEQVMQPVLTDRPAWVITGGAQYFSREAARRPVPSRRRLTCPADGDLTAAVSAVAQRSAVDRAEACFARALAEAGDWRQVR